MADVEEPKPIPPQDAFEILKINLDRTAAAVEGEYSENDRRLNWFLLFQAFLFQGYATALQAVTGAGDNGMFALSHAEVLMGVLIAVGMLTAVVTIDSTRAGVVAIERLKNNRETVFEKAAKELKIEPVGFPTSDPLHHRGLRPTRWSPPILLVAWIIIAAHAWSVVMCSR